MRDYDDGGRLRRAMKELRIQRNRRVESRERKDDTVDCRMPKAVSFMLASVGCRLSPSSSMDMGYKLYDGTQLWFELVIWRDDSKRSM